MNSSLNGIYSSVLKFCIRAGLELSEDEKNLSCLQLCKLTALDISRAVPFASVEHPDQYFL